MAQESHEGGCGATFETKEAMRELARGVHDKDD